MAVCIAVIGKDNTPRFVKCASQDKELEFHYKAHASLDIIEEKLNVGNKVATDSRELFLGLLYPTEEYKIYGYATNTKVKFVVILQSSISSLRDNDVRMIFRKLHVAYSHAVCNPFYIPGDPITSKTFASSVDDLMGL